MIDMALRISGGKVPINGAETINIYMVELKLDPYYRREVISNRVIIKTKTQNKIGRKSLNQGQGGVCKNNQQNNDKVKCTKIQNLCSPNTIKSEKEQQTRRYWPQIKIKKEK